MSWNCSDNVYNTITTHIARQIIDANSPTSLEFVEFIDLNGCHFNVKHAPRLRIVIDLKNGGAGRS